MRMPKPVGPRPVGPASLRPTARVVAAAAMLALVAAVTPAVAGAAAEDDRPEPVLAEAGAPARVKGKLPSTAVRSRFVTIDDDALADGGVGDVLAFEVFPGEAFAGTVDTTGRSGRATTWSGTLDEGRGSWAAARVGGTFHLALTTDDGAFEISSAGGDTYRVAEVVARTPEEDDQVVPPPAAGPEVTGQGAEGPASSGGESATAADGVVDAGDAGDVVDVLVLTTALARTEAGSAEALAAQVATGFVQTNTALASSGVPYRVRQVGLAQTATTEVGGDLSTDLRRLQAPADGFYDEALPARDALHADLVSLWVGGAGSVNCGRAYLADREAYGYGTVVRACATGPSLTFAHETGHNFRAQHDAGASEAPQGTAPYARGYVDLGVSPGIITIMSYWTQCQQAAVSCTKIPHFSNPAVSYIGRPTGTDLANNARAIAENFATVANFRQETIHPATPTITGDPRFGGMLTVQPGAWLPFHTTLGFQWFADGVPLAGATNTALPVTKWMIGRSISVQATGSAPHYSPVVAGSAPTAPVAKAVFGKRRVVLAGKPRVGRVLAVKTRIRPGTNKIRYSWFRGSKRIKGAKGRTYRLTRADRGKKVHVKVIARKKGYETLVKRTRKKRVR